VTAALAAGAFVLFFCRGPTGLPGIWAQHRKRGRLTKQVTDLKTRAVLLKSDIESYQDQERVKKIAQDKLGMTPKPDAEETTDDHR
jgi:cell division protein FtsB